ncbi:MAG: Rrf2 family transcriptional regulator [Anaerolineae bacterium]
MKISTKGEYGIRAMLELAKRAGEGYVQSAEIAAAREIPENYLYQLLITLRKAGLIRSRRGPHGGHMLARSPDHISLLEVIVALEGPIDPVACIQENVTNACSFVENCPVRDVWQHATDAMARILKEADFAQLAQAEYEARAKESQA